MLARPLGTDALHLVLTADCGRWRAVLFLPTRHDPQRMVGQRPLQFQRLRRVRGKPKVDLLSRRENDRHGFGVNRRHDRVGLSRQEADS
jgi:hypothetical protein